MSRPDPGVVIVLNGAPRSGKSSLAAEIVRSFPGRWVNVGVDSMMAATAKDRLPGIGLRPGGERPDLESFVQQQYSDLFADVAMRAMAGANVVVDVGIHDGYSTPLGIADDMANALGGLHVLLVAVQCSLDELRVRRADTGYLSWGVDEQVPKPVQRWQSAVHAELEYDIEVDTSQLSTDECAAAMRPLLATRLD